MLQTEVVLCCRISVLSGAGTPKRKHKCNLKKTKWPAVDLVLRSAKMTQEDQAGKCFDGRVPEDSYNIVVAPPDKVLRVYVVVGLADLRI